MSAVSDPIWLSTKAASARLGLTLRTLYRIIDAGQLPAYKFGRVIRLRQDDVDAFVEASRVHPGDLVHLYPETAGTLTRPSGDASDDEL